MAAIDGMVGFEHVFKAVVDEAANVATSNVIRNMGVRSSMMREGSSAPSTADGYIDENGDYQPYQCFGDPWDGTKGCAP